MIIQNKKIEKIYKYQTKEIFLNKTSLRAGFVFLISKGAYLVKSPRKSDKMREGATVTISNAIAKG